MTSNPKKNTILISIGELFSGPGGGGLGASMSSMNLDNKKILIHHKWATDIDKDTCQTYKKNIQKYQTETLRINEPIQVICDDINNIDLTETGELNSVDGLLFGFPCNDFSIVGESKGINGHFGPLYKHGITVLNRSDKPKWFLAENVGGITSANEGEAFATILKDMDEAGYDLVAHKYKFEDYGIPQKRHRVIIVGIQKELKKTFKVPMPTGHTQTVGEALANIPPSVSHQELTRQSENVIERLKYTKPGENAWTAEMPENIRLKVSKAKLSNIYKRLDSTKPAYTVTGSGGGGTHMYHWEENRALTNRERARIQTFPDWYEFSGSKESIRKQIGMAIPPNGAKIIIESIIATLYDKDYNSTEPNIDVSKILNGSDQLKFEFSE